MKKKIIIILSIIILIFIMVLCYFKYINKTYNVKVVGFHVSKYEVDGYYPILSEVIIEFKTKGKCKIIDELEKHNINYDDSSIIYIWNDNIIDEISNENEKRKNEKSKNTTDYEFTNKLEEISLDTIIDKDLNLLIKVK